METFNDFTAHFFSKLRSKFNQNRPSFIEDIPKDIFLRTR